MNFKWMRDTWDVACKEWLHIRRDPLTLGVALLIPVMQMLLFGFAINFDVRHIPTVVVDHSQTRSSREYVQSLKSTETLWIQGYMESPQEAEEAIRSQKARVAVVIPPDFDRAGQVGILVDGADSQVSNPARMALMRPGENHPEARIHVLFNPNNRTVVYTVPGLLAVILQLISVTLTANSIVREREQGTLEQLMVSPLGPHGLMLGKLLPYFLMSLAELFLILLLGTLVFQVPLRGNPLLLLVLAVPFIIAGLSMGLLISTIARNQAQSLQLSQLTFMPAVLLSGYLAPRETMPGALMLLSNCLPVTYFMQIARGIMVRGCGLAELWAPALSLFGLAVLLLGLAIQRFQKNHL